VHRVKDDVVPGQKRGLVKVAGVMAGRERLVLRGARTVVEARETLALGIELCQPASLFRESLSSTTPRT